MTMQTIQPTQWWQFPFKPVRVTDDVFSSVVSEETHVLEKKYDGFRAVLIVESTYSLWTRDRKRLDIPLNLRDQLDSLALPRGTVLDGEIWNLEKRGSWRHDMREQCCLTFWDTIRVGGRPMSLLPLEERKAALDVLVAGKCADISVVEHLPASLSLLNEIRSDAESHRNKTGCRSGYIHGVVLKRKGSPRRDHATRCVEHSDWSKIVFFAQN